MPITRRHGWRRFRPASLSLMVRAPRETTQKTARSTIEEAEKIAMRRIRQNPIIDQAVELLRDQIVLSPRPERLVALALLLTPQASRAQSMMDAHKHNFHDRKARLFELIDFNDAFVSAVLECIDELDDFSEQFRAAQKRLAKKYHTALFTDGQWDAIEHGLSREVAVFLAAKNAGFDALMTSRTDDAFGIDMQVRDRATGMYVNIDCKTHSSFFFRLKALVRERRLNRREALHAQELGFCAIENCRDDHCARVVLLRIDHTQLGDIVHFQFTDETKIIGLLKTVIETYGMRHDGFGKEIAPL